MTTASIQNIRLVIATAMTRGVAPVHILKTLGLDMAFLLDPDARVPAAMAVRAWRIAAEETGDPTFGLAASETLGPSTHGPFGYAFHASATLGDGLHRLSRFMRLLNGRAGLRVIEEGEHVRVRFEADYEGAPEDLRHPVECLTAALVQVAARATGRSLPLRGVSFRHSAPPDVGRHVAKLGVVPVFGSAVSELVLGREALRYRTTSPDGAMLSAVESHLEERLSRVPAEDDLVARVREAIVEELRGGEPELDRLSARLRTSERTLQRRLQEKGTSLRALVDGVRRDLATRHLAERRESIAEIAFLLGFSDVSAFHRAFRRWTGATPEAYRKGGVAAPRAYASAPGVA